MMQDEEQDLSYYSLAGSQAPLIEAYCEEQQRLGFIGAVLGPEIYAGRRLFQIRQQLYNVKSARNFCPHPPIKFLVGGHKGIRLGDIAPGHEIMGLEYADSAVILSTTSMKVRCRLEIQMNFEREIKSCNIAISSCRSINSTPTVNHSLEMVAHNFSKAIKRLFPSGPLPIGQQLLHVDVNNVFLVELRNVSQGSWQPVLAVEVHGSF